MKRVILVLALVTPAAQAQSLAGTEPLDTGPDWARVMLEGINRYLDGATRQALQDRSIHFKPDFSSADAYRRSLEPNRQQLRRLIGLVDDREPARAFEYVASTQEPALIAETARFKIYTIRWPVLPGVTGEGLLLEPAGKPRACVVAVPDADQTPEQLAGQAPGLAAENQFARRLADAGCRVVVPVLIDRRDTYSGNPRIGRKTNQSHREFIWRMAYQMGRHLIGYEVQRILAAIDVFAVENPEAPVGVYGYCEGGLLALHAAAVDPRIQAAVVSGHFGPRLKIADEPIYRDVWKLLHGFDDASLVRMVVPRALLIEQAEVRQPRVGESIKGKSSTPGRLPQPTPEEALREVERSVTTLPSPDRFLRRNVEYQGVRGLAGDNPEEISGLGAMVSPFLKALVGRDIFVPEARAVPMGIKVDPAPRQKRQFDELVAYTQKLLPEASVKRQSHVWDKLPLKNLDDFKKSQEKLREQFWQETIGKLPDPVKNPRPRTRLILETPKWKGYEVVLDVYDTVISYGILLVPEGIKPGERRPAVVCQHGLEGRPMDVVNPHVRTRAYNSFGAQLADEGFVVFAPQVPYIFGTEFRQAVRKMHPLGLTIYAFIVRQHEVILNFLETLPFVDAARIAYYGLSYGGKVAVRIPAILMRYAAVICSGDFNEWIWKNITLDWGGSYMFTYEYEMFEFDLGNTFNYAEMTALIAPRPFMVERGHDDGVGLDEYVAFEFARTRRLYDRLGVGERTEIEFFVGGHVIHGQGTFAFLRRHLRWPGPSAP